MFSRRQRPQEGTLSGRKKKFQPLITRYHHATIVLTTRWNQVLDEGTRSNLHWLFSNLEPRSWGFSGSWVHEFTYRKKKFFEHNLNVLTTRKDLLSYKTSTSSLHVDVQNWCSSNGSSLREREKRKLVHKVVKQNFLLQHTHTHMQK